MINPQKAVEWYKKKYPVLSLNKSDYDIYDELRHKYTEYEYPTDNPFQIKEELNVPTQEELEEKNNPGFIEKVLTANLSDAYASDSDWWAEAYNKSIAGTIYEIKHGKPKYQVDDIDRAWYDEAGQFFVGLMSPIDVLTFFGSGGIGSIAAKKVATEPLKRMALSGLGKLAGDSTIKKAAATKFGRYLASSAAIESGVSLGTYGAAGAALQDQAQQSIEMKNGQRTERDYLQTTWAATKHGATSLALGSAAGYLTKGLMAPKFAKAKMSTDASFANKITKLTMNPAGQIIAEGSVFGTGQVAERALMGEDIDMDDFLSSIFMNTAIVGGLRASTKVLRIGQDDVSRYKTARKDFYSGIVDPKTGKPVKGLYKDINNNERQSSVAKEIETLNKVEKSFTDAGEVPPRELLDRKSNLETQAEVSKIAYDTFEKNLKDYNDLLTEFNAKDIKDLPKATQVKLLKEAGLVNNVMYEFFTDMQANRELGYQAYKNKFAKDKPLTDIQKKQVDKMVDNKVAEYKDVNEMLNAGALNEPKALNKMKKVFGDGFEVSVKKVKENNFEPVLKTPEGNEVKLASFFKGVKTEKEAKEIASSLNDVYKKVITGEDIGINKALGIKEKNVEYIPIDAKTGKPQKTKEIVKSKWEEDVDVVGGKTIPRNIMGPDKGRWYRTKGDIKKIPRKDIVETVNIMQDGYMFGEKNKNRFTLIKKAGKGDLIDRDIFKTKDTNVLYHVTFTKNISKIKQEGLSTGQKALWKKAATGKDYGKGEVYAFENINDAVSWAQKMEFDLGSKNISIVKIKRGDSQNLRLGPKYIKKRGAESEVNKLVEQGKAVKPKDIGLESGIEIANQTSTKNILNEVNEVAGDVTSFLKDKVKADKIEADRIKEIEYKKMTPASAYATPEKFVNAVQHKVRVISKQYKMNKLKFIETVASEAGIKEPQKFKIKIPKDVNMRDLQDFFITLDKFSDGNFLKKKDVLTKIKSIGEIERQANLINRVEKKAYMEKGLTQAYQKSLLKNVIGVEDGNILKATTKQLKEYNDFLFNYDNVQKDGLGWNVIHDAVEYQNLEGVSTLKDMSKKSLAFIKSQHEAMKHVGAPELSTLLKDHFSIFENNYGGSFNKFMYEVGRIEGNNKSKNKSVTNGDYNIVSGKGEKYLKEIEYINDSRLSKKDRANIKKRKDFSIY